MNNEQPILLGLAGNAGSGKTVVANALSPPAQVVTEDNLIIWTKLSFADPIRRMATAKQKIKGDHAWSRQCYEIHEVISDLFRSNLTYDEVVDLVYEVANLPIEDESQKPRTFMQYVGTDMFRKIDSDIWVKAMKRSIQRSFSLLKKETDFVGIVIDDCRFINECNYFKSQSQGILIRFDVSPEVAQERLIARDKKYISPEEMSHISEQELKLVPNDQFDAIINTDNLSLKEQVAQTKQVINTILGIGDMGIYGALKR